MQKALDVLTDVNQLEIVLQQIRAKKNPKSGRCLGAFSDSEHPSAALACTKSEAALCLTSSPQSRFRRGRQVPGYPA
eukprot:3938196-Rhodomonas_salina.1